MMRFPPRLIGTNIPKPYINESLKYKRKTAMLSIYYFGMA